jgi:ketosteroid isomerase-like protein
MTTRATVEGYFERLGRGWEWEESFADDVVFMSLTSPPKMVTGKVPFLAATRRFYGSIAAVEVRQLIVEGDRACALTRYTVKPPTAGIFESHVPEFFTIEHDRITGLTICFDTAPYPR